jgi:hypothetical protein
VRLTFQQVPTQAETVQVVRRAIETERSIHVYGAAGTGKTHAVRAATIDKAPFWLRLREGPLLGAWFVVELASQLKKPGSILLQRLREGGLHAALEAAGPIMGSRPVVVDDYHRLERGPIDLDDPTPALWADEIEPVAEWLQQRSKRNAVVLVGGNKATFTSVGCYHKPPDTPPIQIEGSSDLVHRWRDFTEKVARKNPGVLVLARAFLSLAGTHAFNEMASQVWYEFGASQLLRVLSARLMRVIPPHWQRVLSVLNFVESCPRVVLEAALSSAARLEMADSSEPSPLDRLIDLGLVETRGGMLTVASFVSSAIRAPTEEEKVTLVRPLTERILHPVNSLSSMEPPDARDVLHAHAIYVALSDFTAAERTARLHLHGLIDLARRTSLSGDRNQAWRQYDAIHFMLKGGGWQVRTSQDRKTRSYVVHYRTWNGVEADHLDLEGALSGYTEAVSDWPENALWRQRKLQCLLRLGRVKDFRDELRAAYRCVPEHPRRDELLRIRPSATAMDAGQPELSLELLEPTLSLTEDEYPTAVDRRDALLHRWASGVALRELSSPVGRLVFMGEVQARVTRTDSSWRASLPTAERSAEGKTPWAAMRTLISVLEEDVRVLVSTPSTRLSAAEVRRKGRLLALIDVLNSDVGLPIAADRWFVGRIEQGHLLPSMRGFDPIKIPDQLLPPNQEGLFLVRVPVSRDGRPSGLAEAIEPAGSANQSAARLVGILEKRRAEA